jgi:hypothetical protein
MGRRFNVDDRQVLDRGQTLDWLESRFIVVFLSVAVLALMAAAVWEWRYPDPVLEIRLLADRNFAIANAYYFLFGFALFGSTVLIPQMLQSLYGYTATDAGLFSAPCIRHRCPGPGNCADFPESRYQAAHFPRISHFCRCHVAIRQH